jgi:hypothetical protein
LIKFYIVIFHFSERKKTKQQIRNRQKKMPFITEPFYNKEKQTKQEMCASQNTPVYINYQTV